MEKVVIIWSAISVALLHSLELDHWLPYVTAARARQWRTGFALLATFTGAVAHLLSTALFGLILLLIGKWLALYLAQWIHVVIGVTVALVGLVFLLRGVRTIILRRSHGEHCGHSERKFLAEGRKESIFFGALCGMRPCLEALPFFWAAAPFGVTTALLTLTGWALASIIGMVGIVWLGLLGLDRLNFKWLERYNEIITGTIITAIGIYAILN